MTNSMYTFLKDSSKYINLGCFKVHYNDNNIIVLSPKMYFYKNLNTPQSKLYEIDT